jgi:hypothetical protein
MSGVGRGGALRLPASVPRTATCGLPVDAAKEQSKIFLASSFCTRGPTKTNNHASDVAALNGEVLKKVF